MADELTPNKPSLFVRRLALAALVVAVLVAHGCVTQGLAQQMAELNFAPAMPPRMEVVYVRDMAVGPVPVAAPSVAAAPAPTRAAPPRPAEAASQPERLASAPARDKTRPLRPAPAPVAPPDPNPVSETPTEPMPAPAPQLAQAEPVAAVSAAAPPEQAPASAAASAPTTGEVVPATATPASAPNADSAAAPFEWPVSTRVSYKLTGNVRGEVHGDAQVEWVRIGNRYQVHLDLTVGLSFAPLMTRRMSSDGDITPQGLSPRRYDQDTKVGFGARQRVAVLFEDGVVVLANGDRRERWAGMQDTASQFIQLTYLFTTQPELLRPGGALEVPLALPRNTSRWVYDVIGEETVYTPIGPIAAVHLKPRRAVVKGGDLSAETWFSPQLRYLPVRIRIQQDADTFIDLVMARQPQLAAP